MQAVEKRSPNNPRTGPAFAAVQAVEKTSSTRNGFASKFAAVQAVEKWCRLPLPCSTLFAAVQAVEKSSGAATGTTTPFAAVQAVEKTGTNNPVKLNLFPLLLDGGIRRGTDIFKALALGASAVLIGRPFVHGLAAAGASGVVHVLHILRTELEIAMALTGRRTLADIDITRLAQPLNCSCHRHN